MDWELERDFWRWEGELEGRRLARKVCDGCDGALFEGFFAIDGELLCRRCMERRFWVSLDESA